MAILKGGGGSALTDLRCKLPHEGWRWTENGNGPSSRENEYCRRIVNIEWYRGRNHLKEVPEDRVYLTGRWNGWGTKGLEIELGRGQKWKRGVCVPSAVSLL